MSDTTNSIAPTKAASLKEVEAIRDLFARAHDYIAQGSHPGHLGMKVAEVLNFLGFQYQDFKTRAERLAKEIEAEAKAQVSKVDVEAAKQATDAALVDQKEVGASTVNMSTEAPKA